MVRGKFSAAIVLQKNKGLQPECHNPLLLLVRPARFELATYGFVVGENPKYIGKNDEQKGTIVK